jgi:hypothetical protein
MKLKSKQVMLKFTVQVSIVPQQWSSWEVVLTLLTMLFIGLLPILLNVFMWQLCPSRRALSFKKSQRHLKGNLVKSSWAGGAIFNEKNEI